MTLREITVAANEFTDERYSESQVIEYANEGISYINGKFKVELPLIVNGTEPYEGFTSSFWTRNLIVPYSAYGIKMNDGSVEEALIYFERFSEAIDMLGNSLHEAVDVKYLGFNKDKIAIIVPRRRW